MATAREELVFLLGMQKQLPTFEGYTVDARLKQFRKAEGTSMEFVDFESTKGGQLLIKYIRSLSKEGFDLFLKDYNP